MEDKSRKVDPGWNDPPMLNYSPVNPPPKSRITNKRVAFPLTQSNANATAPVTGSLPPMSSCEPVVEHSSEELFKRTTKNFDQLLTGVDNEDVVTRIGAMKAMWNEGGLPLAVQKTLYDLSENLIEGNAAKANEKQLKLMMDAGTVCSGWIAAIRHLINSSK